MWVSCPHCWCSCRRLSRGAGAGEATLAARVTPSPWTVTPAACHVTSSRTQRHSTLVRWSPLRHRRTHPCITWPHHTQHTLGHTSSIHPGKCPRVPKCCDGARLPCPVSPPGPGPAAHPHYSRVPSLEKLINIKPRLLHYNSLLTAPALVCGGAPVRCVSCVTSSGGTPHLTSPASTRQVPPLLSVTNTQPSAKHSLRRQYLGRKLG